MLRSWKPFWQPYPIYRYFQYFRIAGFWDFFYSYLEDNSLKLVRFQFGRMVVYGKNWNQSPSRRIACWLPKLFTHPCYSLTLEMCISKRALIRSGHISLCTVSTSFVSRSGYSNINSMFCTFPQFWNDSRTCWDLLPKLNRSIPDLFLVSVPKAQLANIRVELAVQNANQLHRMQHHGWLLPGPN